MCHPPEEGFLPNRMQDVKHSRESNLNDSIEGSEKKRRKIFLFVLLLLVGKTDSQKEI